MDAKEAMALILKADSETFSWEEFGLTVSAVLAAYRLDNPA